VLGIKLAWRLDVWVPALPYKNTFADTWTVAATARHGRGQLRSSTKHS